MAVTLSQGAGIALLFGVSEHAVKEAHEVGVEFIYSSSSTLIIKQGDIVLGAVPIKGAAMTLAKQGNLGPASKSAIRMQIEHALKKAQAASAYSGGQDNEVEATLGDVIEKPAPKKMKISTPKEPSITKDPTPENPALFGVVALKDAMFVGQQVHGTSANSVYRVVAMLPGVSLAARLKGSKLSVRAEGGNLGDYSPGLKKCGFADGGGYYSCHYTVGEKELAVKTIGAIVALLAPSGSVTMANVSEILS